jgi:hypothetical protein
MGETGAGGGLLSLGLAANPECCLIRTPCHLVLGQMLAGTQVLGTYPCPTGLSWHTAPSYDK